MLRYLLTASLISLVSGCTGSCPPSLGHQDCTDVQAYSGPPLRAPFDTKTYRLKPQSTSGLTASEVSALTAAFQQASEATEAHSLTAAVWQAGGAPWTQSSGTPEGHVHYWASVGKIITAAAVLKLVEDGWLSLDQPISEYVDDVPNGEIIPLLMLMDHT
jgi:D-alanyl-D-alanine carboxypeptidase